MTAQYSCRLATGIIDELRLEASPADGGAPRVFLREHKTRSASGLPRAPQLRTARLQLMLYKMLFDGLLQATSSSGCQQLCAVHDLQVSRKTLVQRLGT